MPQQVSEQRKRIESLLASHGRAKREVYLDLENSGLIFKEALERMIEAYREHGYGHPSITHKPGWSAYEIILEAMELSLIHI